MPKVNGKHFPYTKKGMKDAKKAKEHHSGKGTKARLNTAAEKHMFRTKYSD